MCVNLCTKNQGKYILSRKREQIMSFESYVTATKLWSREGSCNGTICCHGPVVLSTDRNKIKIIISEHCYPCVVHNRKFSSQMRLSTHLSSSGSHRLTLSGPWSTPLWCHTSQTQSCWQVGRDGFDKIHALVPSRYLHLCR